MLRPGDNSPIGRVSVTEALAHFSGNSATGGIWRIRADSGTAILKIAVPNGETETQWNYWQREPLAYRDGFIDRYLADSGITAPRLLHSITRPDGGIELWLDDVTGTPGDQWTVERLGAFAAQLGAVQARWRDTTDSPPWLSRHFLRRYAGLRDFAHIDWDHPVAARHWPRPLRQGLRRLWGQRAALFDLAERLPGTICHLDVWPKNLFANGDETIAIDWAFFGHGAIGEDIANLIPDTALDGLMDVNLLDDIREAVITSYVEGFHDAGGDLSESDIRRAVAITGAAKYVWLAPLMLTRLAEGLPLGSQNYDPDSGTAEVLQRRRRVFDMLVAWSGTA